MPASENGFEGPQDDNSVRKALLLEKQLRLELRQLVERHTAALQAAVDQKLAETLGVTGAPPSIAQEDSRRPPLKEASCEPDERQALLDRSSSLVDRRPSLVEELARRGVLLRGGQGPNTYTGEDPGEDEDESSWEGNFDDVQSITPEQSKLHPKFAARLRETRLRELESLELNAVALCILTLGAVLVAWETYYVESHNAEDYPWYFHACNLMVCVGLVTELVVRIRIQGAAHFFNTNYDSWIWHVLQIFFVVVSVLEEGLDFQDLALGWTSCSSRFRLLLRCTNTLRVVRLLHVMDRLDSATELHLLLTSISGSLRSLTWSVVMLVLIMYMFGITLTKGVLHLTIEAREDPHDADGLFEFWGTLDRSMLTLFATITSGMSWTEAMRPLRARVPWLAAVYLSYIGVTVFVVLNILTGVFVNTATAAGAEETTKNCIRQLQRLFKEADGDNSGTLRFVEFQHMLSSKSVSGCLENLGIKPDRARLLFTLLDKDHSGEVECKEFLDGCVRLQGSAKAIDFAVFINEWEPVRDRVTCLGGARRSSRSGLAPGPAV